MNLFKTSILLQEIINDMKNNPDSFDINEYYLIRRNRNELNTTPIYKIWIASGKWFYNIEGVCPYLFSLSEGFIFGKALKKLKETKIISKIREIKEL